MSEATLTLTSSDGFYVSTTGTTLTTGAVVAPPVAPVNTDRPWSGPIAFENEPTGDHRMFAGGSIAWATDSLPLPFRWVRSDSGGHESAVVIGRVDNIYRDSASPGVIFANGVIFNGATSPPEAAEYLDLLANGAAGGVSVDGDSAEFNVLETDDGTIERHFTAMRLRSVTAVAIPAFINARIALGESPDRDVAAGMVDSAAILAAAIPTAPPLDWFSDPALPGPTPLTVTSDGRVYGHLALFGTCHIAQSQCVTPPKNSTYVYFHIGELITAEGEAVDVGHMTFNTGHAALSDSALAAVAHYDHTGTVAADVRAGEDDHGIWLAGALRSTLTDDDIRAFRAAPPSGDWRRIGGRLELRCRPRRQYPRLPRAPHPGPGPRGLRSRAECYRHHAAV